MLKKILLGGLVAIVGLGALAYVKRVDLVLALAASQKRTDIPDNKPIAWMQGPAAAQATEARQRYNTRKERQLRESQAHQLQQEESARNKLAHLAEHSQITDPALLDRKRSLIEAAIARAKERKTGTPQ